MTRSSYYTRRKKVRTGRKSRQTKTGYSRRLRLRRSTKRGAGKTDASKSRKVRPTPYKTLRSPSISNKTLLSLLAKCSEYSKKVRESIENPNRRLCKFDKSCYRENVEHRLSFKHSNENLGQNEIDAYRGCTEQFLDKSWELYKRNDNQLPNEWYVAIATYLQTSDYSDHRHLYFNILANICQHGLEYTQKYSKRFIENLLIGMEESAVTGMFDITSRPELMECLARMNSPDDRYLSNTALLALVRERNDEELN